MEFINLKLHPEYLPLVNEAFKRFIEPKFGPQEKALQKIIDGKERICEILVIRNQPEGLIIYKTALQEEYGLKQAFELKTALLFEPVRDRGFGPYLFYRAEHLAIEAGAQYIYTTMSDANPRLLSHLENEGFEELMHCASTDNHIPETVICKKLEPGVRPTAHTMTQLMHFFHRCEKLKMEKRHGQTSDHEQDRVAAHSWRMAVMAMFVGSYLDKDIDLLKTIKLALIHDMAEIITGDQAYYVHMFNETERNNKDHRETAAMPELARLLPFKDGEDLLALWNEYEEQVSYESRVVKAIDKLEAHLQHNEADISVWNEYDVKHYRTMFDQFCDFDAALRKLKELLRDESTHKLDTEVPVSSTTARRGMDNAV